MLGSKFGLENPVVKGDTLWFALDDIEGMRVSWFGHYNPTKRNELKLNRKAVNKVTGQKKNIYTITIDNESVEIRVGNEVATLKIKNGQLEWK